MLRTTRANLDTQKTGSNLIVGEPYLITDENRIAVATAVNNYYDFALKSEADGKLANIVEDTTPQLGGSLDLNSKPLTEVFTAGEALSSGNLCYLKSDGKFWKTDADAEGTTKGLLALANASINADATGEFIVFGRYTTTGLTAGSVYYVSATTGAITATAPSTTGQQVRVIGYALSTTVLFFNPSQTWIEVA